MFGQMGNLADLMKNAGKIRESLERAAEELGRIEVEGDAAAGAVVARVNGRLELVSLRIDETLAREGDMELLEELVLAAVNQGLTKAREAAARSMQSMAGLAMPPGLGDVFGGGLGGRP